MTDWEANLGRLVDVALAQWQATLSDSDAVDTKALGIMAADLAAAAVLLVVTVTRGWNPWWLLPVVPVGLALVLLFAAARVVSGFDYGPNTAILRDEFGGLGAGDFADQVLVDLQDAVKTNRGVMDTKVRFLEWGMGLSLTAGLAAAGVYVALVR